MQARLTGPKYSVRPGTLVVALCAALIAACTNMEEATEPEVAPQAFSDEIAVVETMLEEAPATGLRATLEEEAARAPTYELDTLAIPAGSWDGYAQATEGSFLQCLVAWGPRDARLAFSVGWQGRLFVQFTAPGWSAETVAPDNQVVIRVDQSAETTVPVGASGNILWASLGTNPAFASVITEGSELVIVADNDQLVFPLDDANIAIPALYECLDRETGEMAGDGAFAIYGLRMEPDPRAELEAEVRGLIEERGFGDFVALDPETTVTRYGRHAVMAGSAWDGRVELFATVFGARPGAKKGLAELVDDAARICRGEVTARIVRVEPLLASSREGDSFGRSSLLCAARGDEFAMETLAFFSGGEVVALHAIVRSAADRDQVERNFNDMKAVIVSEL